MKKFVFILMLVFLGGCTSVKYSYKLPLFNTVSLQLLEGEKENENLTEAAVTFQKMVSTEIIQIPLYKYVEAEEYDFFVGLPLGINLETEEINYLNDSFKLNSVEFEKNKSSYKVYERENIFLVEFIVKLKNSKFYSLFRTDSPRILKSILDLENVKERFK